MSTNEAHYLTIVNPSVWLLWSTHKIANNCQIPASPDLSLLKIFGWRSWRWAWPVSALSCVQPIRTTCSETLVQRVPRCRSWWPGRYSLRAEHRARPETERCVALMGSHQRLSVPSTARLWRDVFVSMARHLNITINVYKNTDFFLCTSFVTPSLICKTGGGPTYGCPGTLKVIGGVSLKTTFASALGAIFYINGLAWFQVERIFIFHLCV